MLVRCNVRRFGSKADIPSFDQQAKADLTTLFPAVAKRFGLLVE